MQTLNEKLLEAIDANSLASKYKHVAAANACEVIVLESQKNFINKWLKEVSGRDLLLTTEFTIELNCITERLKVLTT